MSKIALKGNASGTGTFQIEAPNSNTDRTLVLPDEAGTVLTSASDITPSASPVFDVRAVDIDQSISSGSFTKVQMNTSVIDTDSMIDLTNNRVTPTVAGYYAVSGQVRLNFNAGIGSTQIIIIEIRKNGSTVTRAQIQTTDDRFDNGQYPMETVVVQVNGSTDYIELYAYVGDAGTLSDTTTNAESSVLCGFLVRAT